MSATTGARTAETMLSLTDVRKEFRYLNPDPNNNDTDMWVSYILGMLGLKTKGQFGAKRRFVKAVDGVSLDVATGEFFGLLGPNGAGKSTLVKLIATILTPSSGRIRVNGYDVAGQRSFVRASLSVVPAGGWLSFDSQLTVAENLRFWGRLHGLRRDDVERNLTDALAVVGLPEWRDESPGTSSSGMRQRLAIAQGLLVRAPLFVLDEPTAYVDPAGSAQIQEFILHELNRRLGQTVIIATHDMAEAEHLCDRVALIDQGRIVACDRPAKLVQSLAGRVFMLRLPRALDAATATFRASDVALRVLDFPDGDGGGEIRLLLADGTGASDVSGVLEGAGLAPGEIQSTRATLEDVFLLRTGKGLGRDE